LFRLCNNSKRRVGARNTDVGLIPESSYATKGRGDLVVIPEDIATPVKKIMRSKIRSIPDTLLQKIAVLVRVVNAIHKADDSFSFSRDRFGVSLERIGLLKEALTTCPDEG
jgi:hypothetical protein